MDRMIVYNIVDNEFRAGDDNEPNVTIVGRMAIAVTRTIYIRCEIPVGGMGFMELMGMSTRLGIRAAVLAEQLNRPEYGGVAGPIVADMAQLNRMDVNRVADGLIINNLVNQMVRRTPVETRHQPRIVDVDSVAEDEVCAICLQEKKDDPSLPWAIAAGCTRHKYHRECLEPWRGNHCMTCRAPLERA